MTDKEMERLNREREEAFKKAMEGITAFNKEARSAIDTAKNMMGKK